MWRKLTSIKVQTCHCRSVSVLNGVVDSGACKILHLFIFTLTGYFSQARLKGPIDPEAGAEEQSGALADP